MTLQDFLNKYKFEYGVQNTGNGQIVATTKVIKRSDGLPVDRVITTMDIQETSTWLSDSQTAISLIPWDWNKLEDQIKRMQLDYFVLRVPIDDFLPMNTDTDITKLYL